MLLVSKFYVDWRTANSGCYRHTTQSLQTELEWLRSSNDISPSIFGHDPARGLILMDYAGRYTLRDFMLGIPVITEDNAAATQRRAHEKEVRHELSILTIDAARYMQDHNLTHNNMFADHIILAVR